MMTTNSKSVIVIVDGSGSMNEWGKRDLIFNLLICISQIVSPSFFIWSDVVTPFEFNDFDKFKFSGVTNLPILLNFLQNYDECSDIILISDGHIKLEPNVNFDNFNIFPIICGLDGITSNVKNIFGNYVFKPYDILKILR